MKTKHAVHRLFEQRLKRSTKPFNARGSGVKRCSQCRIDQQFCMCSLRPSTQTEAGFLLLYYDDEVLKPSNTGKLIADLFPDTFAFIWQRSSVEPDLITLLAQDCWFPMVVFPSAYVQEPRKVYADQPCWPDNKRPLFILLDGSWREAKKMFRKSPYLDDFPVLSITPDQVSRYFVRKAAQEHQLATAEVASLVLGGMNEPYNAQLLSTWFDLFSYRYQQGVKRQNIGDADAERRLKALLAP